MTSCGSLVASSRFAPTRRSVGLVGLALTAVVVSACATSSTTPRVPKRESAPAGSWHEVKSGETLWSLAARNGLTVDEIAEVNGLSQTDHLVPGQLLFLPASGQPERPPQVAGVAPVEPAAPATEGLGWPIDGGVLLRVYEPAADAPSDGLLLAAPEGTTVLAADDGVVAFVGDEGTAHGEMIILEHSDSRLTIYGHLSAIEVAAGDRVKKGQTIAKVGTSGRAESPQLHFQVRSGRTPVDPLQHLPPP